MNIDIGFPCLGLGTCEYIKLVCLFNEIECLVCRLLELFN